MADDNNMLEITADHIWALARSGADEPALAIVDGEIRVVDAAEAEPQQIFYTRRTLIEESGVEVTEPEAATIAAGLTARLSEGNQVKGISEGK